MERGKEKRESGRRKEDSGQKGGGKEGGREGKRGEGGRSKKPRSGIKNGGMEARAKENGRQESRMKYFKDTYKVGVKLSGQAIIRRPPPLFGRPVVPSPFLMNHPCMKPSPVSMQYLSALTHPSHANTPFQRTPLY